MAHTCGPSPGEAEAGGSAFKVSLWCGRPKEKRKTERRAWLSLRGWGRWMLLSIAKGPEPSSGSLGTSNLAVPPCHHPLPTAATEAAVKGCGREIASLWKLRVEKTQTQDEHTDGTAGLCLGEGLGVGDGPQATDTPAPGWTGAGGLRLPFTWVTWTALSPRPGPWVINLHGLNCFFHGFWDLNSGPRCAAGLSTEPRLGTSLFSPPFHICTHLSPGWP